MRNECLARRSNTRDLDDNFAILRPGVVGCFRRLGVEGASRVRLQFTLIPFFTRCEIERSRIAPRRCVTSSGCQCGMSFQPAENFTRVTKRPGLLGSPYKTAVCGGLVLCVAGFATPVYAQNSDTSVLKLPQDIEFKGPPTGANVDRIFPFSSRAYQRERIDARLFGPIVEDYRPSCYVIGRGRLHA